MTRAWKRAIRCSKLVGGPTVAAALTVGTVSGVVPGLGIFSSESAAQFCEPQVVDDFDAESFPLEATASELSGARADGPLTGVVGSERELAITRTAPDPPLQGTAALSVASGVFTWSNAITVVSEGSLTWDGPDGDPTTLDPVGLDGANYSGAGDAGVFSFEVTAWDIPVEAPFALDVYTDAGAASTQTVTPTPVPVPIGTVVEFPISGFTPLVGAGADFGNVGAIVLQFAASDQDLDMAFDAFTAPCPAEVPPEPPVPPAPPEGPTERPIAITARPTFTG